MKWLSNTLIRNPLEVGLCKSEREYKRELKKLKLTSTDTWLSLGAIATVHSFRNTVTNRRVALVCIDGSKKYNPRDLHETMTHEAVHLWQEIRQAIHEHEPSSEFEAYAIENLTKQLIDAYAA